MKHEDSTPEQVSSDDHSGASHGTEERATETAPVETAPEGSSAAAPPEEATLDFSAVFARKQDEEIEEEEEEESEENYEEDVEQLDQVEAAPKNFVEKVVAFFTKTVASFSKRVEAAKAESAAAPKPQPTKRRKIDDSPIGLDKDYRKRMGRSINAITSRPVSSHKGGPARQKKKSVASKTYKPELNRF